MEDVKETKNSFLQAFADDLSFVKTGTNPKYLIREAQRVTNKIVDWGRANKLTFNPKKCTATIYTRKSIALANLPKICVDNVPIKYVDSCKYLGITLDSKLAWNKHIEDRITSAKKLLFKVRHAAGKLWGLNPKWARYLYTGILRP